MNLLDKTMTHQRPIAISVLAIFMLLGFFMSLRSLAEATESSNVIVWYYYFSIIITLLSLATAIGLLLMKKLAVYLYITYIPISLYTQYYVSGVFNIYGAIFAIFFIAIMLKYIKKMD
ncbi:MAG: hypothetical protein OQK11_03210 [Thiovulaceae bacterium]|nr:hypothetical protein [Sulfurimonadaceae bacterium]